MKLNEYKSQMAILLAKIGVFFANCDGNYDSREKQFISNFIMELENTESLEDELKELLENTVTATISFDEIKESTQKLLDCFNHHEQEAIIDCLNKFIEKVINADGIQHSKELKYAEEWNTFVNQYT